MQTNFLEEIVEDIAGIQAKEIVKLLEGKKDVNEFLIAKKLKLTINQARNILYKLSEAGLVSSTRKKDKRKGWFIYFWTLDALKSLELLEKRLLEEAARLKHLLQNRKSRRFYFCKTCNVEVGEESALLNQFTCLECGQVYELADSSTFIKDIEGKISKIEKQLVVISEEKGKVLETWHKKNKRKTARHDSKIKKQKEAVKIARKKAALKKAKESGSKEKIPKEAEEKKAAKKTAKKPKKKAARKK
ncbi:hypothetical protein A3K73_06140 [Candidatus Pacearchaeota archaeon RBG_13_36_9]|nr:MAG: hypothetical protein A3K73_06140 [Candidatus Pacearchaeota archaeon RBG_13_36_9]